MADKLCYLLRNIPPGLWLSAKDAARRDCCSLRELIIRALENHVKREGRE